MREHGVKPHRHEEQADEHEHEAHGARDPLPVTPDVGLRNRRVVLGMVGSPCVTGGRLAHEDLLCLVLCGTGLTT